MREGVEPEKQVGHSCQVKSMPACLPGCLPVCLQAAPAAGGCGPRFDARQPPSAAPSCCSPQFSKPPEEDEKGVKYFLGWKEGAPEATSK